MFLPASLSVTPQIVTIQCTAGTPGTPGKSMYIAHVNGSPLFEAKAAMQPLPHHDFFFFPSLSASSRDFHNFDIGLTVKATSGGQRVDSTRIDPTRLIQTCHDA